MNLQDFCEVPWQLYANHTQVAYNQIRDNNMAKKESHPYGSTNSHRTYVPDYRLAIYNAKNIGEMVTAMYLALSSAGYNNWGDASPELAKKCLAKLNEAKHNTQEV